MSEVTYIDKNTFEVNNDIIEIDTEIVDTIILLNKKGYKTKYCCAGHNDKTVHTRLLKASELEGDLLEKYDVGVMDVTVEKDKKRVYYRPSSTDIYIMFDKDYKFKTLPEGFKKKGKWDKDGFSNEEFNMVEKTLSYFNNHVRKSDEQILKEITTENQKLLKWAHSLPNNLNN